jgi:microcystin-dependent protein
MEAFIGEIRLFAGNFAPLRWAFCQGQSLLIHENEALFALIGTIYGGDGQQTFRLPDLTGRIPVHQGQNYDGGSFYQVGKADGTEVVTLSGSNIPAHSHTLHVKRATAQAPSGNATHRAPFSAQGGHLPAAGTIKAYSTKTPKAALNAVALQASGGNQPHNNMQPFLCINYIICLEGIFPPRN